MTREQTIGNRSSEKANANFEKWNIIEEVNAVKIAKHLLYKNDQSFTEIKIIPIGHESGGLKSQYNSLWGYQDYRFKIYMEKEEVDDRMIEVIGSESAHSRDWTLHSEKTKQSWRDFSLNFTKKDPLIYFVKGCLSNEEECGLIDGEKQKELEKREDVYGRVAMDMNKPAKIFLDNEICWKKFNFKEEDFVVERVGNEIIIKRKIKEN